MIKWNCDAMLPRSERYASLKFRRVSSAIQVPRLEFGEAVELCAFLSLMEIKHARYIFGWNEYYTARVRELYRVFKDYPEVKVGAEDNRDGWTPEDGFRILDAMKDGGFVQGSVPPITRMAMIGLRDTMSLPKIGKLLGFTEQQVRVMMYGIKKPAPLLRVADLVA